jgi:cytochrome c oxidase subunit 1
MHIMGLQGQPRRMYIWTDARSGEGFFNLGFWNLVSSIGSFILAVGVLFFLINVWVSRKNPPAPADPWDARSLEWITTSPPKEHNFDRIPTVHALDEFFHRKYEDVGSDGHHDFKQVATGEQIIAEEEAHAEAHIHLPSPSYWPIVLSFGMLILAYGVIYSTLLIMAGAAICILALFGWALEPPTAPDTDFDPPADGQPSKELAHV